MPTSLADSFAHALGLLSIDGKPNVNLHTEAGKELTAQLVSPALDGRTIAQTNSTSLTDPDLPSYRNQYSLTIAWTTCTRTTISCPTL